MPSADDLALCRARIADGSRSFHMASRLLPVPVADAAIALYAFCRLADDSIDAHALPEGLDAALGPQTGRDGDAVLQALYGRLDRAAAGDPLDAAVDRAFADTLERHRIPAALPRALLEGMAWDLEGRAYETPEQLLAYCARVASAVGAMMALVMGVRDPARLARACDLGTAMQLTNIARDVGEDAAMGRIYLPRRWLREEGVDPARWLEDPRPCAPMRACTARLLALADTFYRRALPGIRALPAPVRPAIHAAASIYAQIGREVAGAGFDSVSRRAVVPTGRKVALASLALVRALQPGPRDCGQPVHPANRFLVQAVLEHDEAEGREAPEPIRPGWAFLVDLLIRLEQRDRSGAGMTEGPGG